MIERFSSVVPQRVYQFGQSLFAFAVNNHINQPCLKYLWCHIAEKAATRNDYCSIALGEACNPERVNASHRLFAETDIPRV
jgi:hypothetical protein